MGYLTDAVALLLGEHVQVVGERRERVVGRARHGYAALETVGVVAHHTVEGVGRAAHHHVPQQVVDMHVHRLGAAGLALVARAVVGLAQHHGEVAHRRTPFLRHRVGFGCEGEGMLAACVGESLGKVGHGVVQRQAAHGQLGLLGLLLLVLGGALPLAPLVLLLLVDLVHGPHLTGPLVHYGVDASLARGEVASDVGDKVESAHLAVDVHLDVGGKHSYCGADGSKYG